MGMYSRLEVRVTIRPDAPDYVKAAVNWLANAKDRGDDSECPYKDDHKFWRLSRNHQIGKNYGWTERYGDDFSNATQNEDGSMSVLMRTHCKDYDGQIQAFLLWLWPFVSEKVDTAVGLYAVEQGNLRGIRAKEVIVGGEPAYFKAVDKDGTDEFLKGLIS